MACSGRGGVYSTCNTRGRCLNLKDMALLAKNQYLQSSPIVYGSAPWDSKTWDAEMIQGCVNDEYGSWLGPTNISSSEEDHTDSLSCPVGYNVRLKDDLSNSSQYNITDMEHEVQEFVCIAREGYFNVSFRGKTTPNIPHYTTAFRFKKILEALPTVGWLDLHMTYDNNGTKSICDQSGYRRVFIKFKSVIGDLPMLTINQAYLEGGHAYVNRVRQSGRYGLMECSGHGKCDRKTGVCKCFPQWASSDGLGGPGPNGDCGHNSVI